MKEYIAGFLDADGTVYMKTNGSIGVQFFNADLSILQEIAKHYKGLIKTRKGKAENHNISHSLVIRYDGALRLLTDVAPYMLHKKKKARAELIVQYYKQYTPRNGYYTPELKERKQWLIKEVKGIVMRGKGAYV